LLTFSIFNNPESETYAPSLEQIIPSDMKFLSNVIFFYYN
jgi:hypothetical protein